MGEFLETQRIFSRLHLTSDSNGIGVRLSKSGELSETFALRVYDISPTGTAVQLHTEQCDFNVGDKISLEITGIDESNLVCQGEIVRREDKLDTVNIAIQFQDLPLFERDMIKKRLDYAILRKQYQSEKKFEPTASHRLLTSCLKIATISLSIGLAFGYINKMAPDLEPLVSLFLN